MSFLILVAVTVLTLFFYDRMLLIQLVNLERDRSYTSS